VLLLALALFCRRRSCWLPPAGAPPPPLGLLPPYGRVVASSGWAWRTSLADWMRADSGCSRGWGGRACVTHAGQRHAWSGACPGRAALACQLSMTKLTPGLCTAIAGPQAPAPHDSRHRPPEGGSSGGWGGGGRTTAGSSVHPSSTHASSASLAAAGQAASPRCGALRRLRALEGCAAPGTGDDEDAIRTWHEPGTGLRAGAGHSERGWRMQPQDEPAAHQRPQTTGSSQHEVVTIPITAVCAHHSSSPGSMRTTDDRSQASDCSCSCRQARMTRY
jgi:hypothetical protein